jgi:uncharacterized protein
VADSVTLAQAAFLFGAAFVAGVLNAVAFGGSFISFPALLFTAMPPINANATNTAALWPGTIASTGAYRRVFTGDVLKLLPPLVAASLLGGLLGARLLLRTPQATFMRLVPWLLLAGTLLFLASGRVSVWVRERSVRLTGSTRPAMAAGVLLQLLLAIYIGYFGAGVGVLMLAMLALIGVQNIHAMNGMRVLLASVANGVAIVTFISAKVVIWPQALLMLVAASLGGYGGAFYVQKINPQRVRQFVIFLGFAMSLYFFIRH